MKYKKIIKEFIPPVLLNLLRKMKIPGIKAIKKEYRCPICDHDLTHFNRLPDYYFEMHDKYGYVHSSFYSETMNLLKYSCPVCGTSDRNRLYALYLKDKFKKDNGRINLYQFLDIAPDISLSVWIKGFPFIQYRSVDLNMEDVDDKADITDLSIYETDRFNIILCSHVLEHIEDDRKAMAEIFRVLKPGGFAIVMVPVLLSLQEDLENPEWTTEADRWKYYGQDDHVRMYSKVGFVRKLEQTGFIVRQLGIDYFGIETYEKHGIHHRSVLYIVEK